MADTLRAYYLALVPPRDQPEIGPEGLPVVWRYIYLRDVTIERGTQDQASFLARQNERGGCVRNGRDGFGVTLLCMEGEREDLVVERL